MNSQFGTKLFRLFLLFALVPSIVLALAGYYLAVETSEIPSFQSSLDSSELADYYNDYLFAEIDNALVNAAEAGSPTETDFSFMLTREATEAAVGLRPEALEAITRAARTRSFGFVDVHDTVYQFSSLRLGPDSLLVAGLIHDRIYSSIISSLETDRASRRSIEQLKLHYVTFLALLFISLASVAVIVAYLFSTRFSRNLSTPVLELSRAAEKIADGDFTQTVTTTAVGEIQTLVSSFNRMSGQLDEMTSRLAQTERVAAWRSIARRFAHELKNPLQPILVSLYRIEKKLQGSDNFDQVRQPLQAASEEMKHLVDLADRFSQLAKLPPPSVKDVNLGELLKSISQLYESHLAPFGFKLELPEEDIHYQLDPTYFREALHNLLQNAVDASSPGDRIELKLTVGSDSVAISVTDTGCGMPSEVAASARMPYFTTKEKGNGLGLAIVEKIVNELGGRLLIESDEGQGTTATIELPRKRN